MAEQRIGFTYQIEANEASHHPPVEVVRSDDCLARQAPLHTCKHTCTFRGPSHNGGVATADTTDAAAVGGGGGGRRRTAAALVGGRLSFLFNQPNVFGTAMIE